MTAGTHHEITTEGILFDLDGTLINSIEGVERFWSEWAVANGYTAQEVLDYSHGTRTIEVIRKFRPELANEKYVAELEYKLPTHYGKQAKAIPGGVELIKSLPPSKIGVVTSGTRMTASSWLQDFLKVQIPAVFVPAEDVVRGKPDPEGYLLGAKQLGVQDFVVFEDAPAGIKAGKKAGALVVGLTTTYPAERVKEAGADIVIEDLTHVELKKWNPETKSLTLTLTNCIL